MKPKLSELTLLQKEEMCALACGWKLHSELDHTWCAPWQSECPLVAALVPLPAYGTSHDAMMAARATLTESEQRRYAAFVYMEQDCSFQDLCTNSSIWRVIKLTAEEHLNVFLRVKNLIGKQ